MQRPARLVMMVGEAEDDGWVLLALAHRSPVSGPDDPIEGPMVPLPDLHVGEAPLDYLAQLGADRGTPLHQSIDLPKSVHEGCMCRELARVQALPLGQRTALRPDTVLIIPPEFFFGRGAISLIATLHGLGQAPKPATELFLELIASRVFSAGTPKLPGDDIQCAPSAMRRH